MVLSRPARPGLLVVHDSLRIIGGGERLLLRLAALSRHQARIDLAVLSGRGAALQAADAEIFDEIVDLDAPTAITVASAPSHWRAHRRLVGVLSRLRPAACLAFSYPSAIRSALAVRGPGTPLIWVCQEHIAGLLDHGRPLRRRLAFGALRTVKARIVCLNDATVARLAEAGFPRDRLHRIEIGVPAAPPPTVRSDAELGAARRQRGIPDADLVALCVAHLNPAKRHDLLLEAVRRARDAGTRIALVCVGGQFPNYPEHAAALRAQTRRLGVEELVSWVGLSSDVHGWLELADVVVLASSHEVAPLALFEAAAAGRALVGSDAPGIREAIRDGETGLLFRSGDAAACAAALVRLAREPLLRSALGAAAKGRVEGSQERMERAWDRIVEEILDAAASADRVRVIR